VSLSSSPFYPFELWVFLILGSDFVPILGGSIIFLPTSGLCLCLSSPVLSLSLSLSVQSLERGDQLLDAKSSSLALPPMRSTPSQVSPPIFL
jgi:hypothetical protein